MLNKKDVPRLQREDTVLLVTDVQEKFVPHLFEGERLLKNCALLIRACRIMNIPILVSEQYPQGLGRTAPELREALGEFEPITKMSFSSLGCNAFREALQATGRKSLLLCGIETHVCVIQTAMDAVEQGYSVFMPVDAISSRSPLNWEAGIRRARSLGVVLVTTEMAIFELLKTAEAKEFKEVQRLVKELSPV